MNAIYDRIGIDYSQLRRPDPRIASRILEALGPAQTVLNVGAGTGSYEPRDRRVTAIEPSLEMIRQRPASAAPAMQGKAEALPFADQSFDACMAVLTVHHWGDKKQGMAEMRRVTRGPIVVVTFDPAHRGAWLNDYFPELVTLDETQMPCMSDYEQWLGPVRIEPLPIPRDCTDGFLYAYWARPAAYLDEAVRSGISSFWKIGGLQAGLLRLRRDLESGEWECRYGELRAQEECDLGYRLVTAI
jgi:SAM-dependent methyltransferase